MTKTEIQKAVLTLCDTVEVQLPFFQMIAVSAFLTFGEICMNERGLQVDYYQSLVALSKGQYKDNICMICNIVCLD